MADLITRKRAIDYIKLIGRVADLIARCIADAPAEDMEDRPRWFSVTDRLPLDHQTMLCYSDTCDVNQAIALSTKNGMIFVDPCEEYFEFSHVTHWMEMPKLPKEVDS